MLAARAAGDPLTPLVAAGSGPGFAGVAQAAAAVAAPPQVPAADPAAAAAWWEGLTPAARQAAIAADPGGVGALDGVPAAARDQANRLLLDQALASPGRDGYGVALDTAARLAALDAGGTAQLVAFDPAREVVALSVGDLDTAAAVGVLVPGMATTPDDLPGLVADATSVGALAAAALPGLAVATLVWLGYSTPNLLTVASAHQARDGGVALDRALDGLAASRGAAAAAGGPPPPRTTVLAHSYGTVVAGYAARAEGRLAADAVVLLGSPGVPEDDAADLEAPEVLRRLDARWTRSPTSAASAPARRTRGSPTPRCPPPRCSCTPSTTARTSRRWRPWRRSWPAPGSTGERGPRRAQAVRSARGAARRWPTVASAEGCASSPRHVQSAPPTGVPVPTKTAKPAAQADAGAPSSPPRKRAAGARGGKPLVIVESPSKAKTIAGYLGSDYVVEASVGHIRDLPRNAADVPAAHKGESWARLGVDVDNGFAPLYVISPDRKQQVSRLKQLVKDASEVYLATDEDREGEAIAWHLVDTLKPTVPVRRMVFHEITPEAIARAVASPRELDTALVDAQETRRILDRLYGYEVSPVLWKKVLPKLSAGRVQSVATRIVVERERARMRFTAADYWSLTGTFDVAAADSADDGEPRQLTANLVALDDSRIATGRDFDADTGAVASNVVHLDEAGARGLAARLENTQVSVTRVDEKRYTRRPYAPFTTSTLQQEAGRKFGWSSQQVMRTAQRLYENGHITYMRTDSTNLSGTALRAARTQARELYGDAFVPAEARHYSKKVKGAQEAHEAIRPAGDTFRTPGQLAGQLAREEFRLYELIWQRTVASQMADAVGQTVTIRLAGRSSTDEVAEFSASGRTITFPGFLRAYVEGKDEGGSGDDAEVDDSERRLPRVERGQVLDTAQLDAKGHTTSPPARYTEPSLTKALEELGIGRPSTYASIMQTIQDRGYVWKKGSALVPTFIAFAVVNLLEQHFAALVDYDFTASLEGELDEIAGGTLRRVDWLTEFYFGGGGGHAGGIAASGGLKSVVGQRLEEIDARGVNSIPLKATGPAGEPVVVRVGRYGPYLQAGGDDGARVSIADDIAPDELTADKVRELLEAPSGDRELGTDPDLRPPGRGQGRPVRPLRHHRRPRGQQGGPAHGQPVQDDAARDRHPRGRPQAAEPAPHRRQGRGRRGDPGAQRPLRALPEEGHRLPLDRQRGEAVHHHAGRGAGDLRPAQAARAGRGQAAAGRAGPGPGHQRHGDRARGPVRSLRHRRGVQRQPAQGRRPADHHPRARRRAAGRPPRAGPGEEEGHQEGGRQEGTGQEVDRRSQDHGEEADREEDDGEEDSGEDDGGEDDDGGGHRPDHDQRRGRGPGRQLSAGQGVTGDLEPATWDARRASFGSVAADRAALRPGHPADAVASRLGGAPLRVLDLGAGAGLLGHPGTAGPAELDVPHTSHPVRLTPR